MNVVLAIAATLLVTGLVVYVVEIRPDRRLRKQRQRRYAEIQAAAQAHLAQERIAAHLCEMGLCGESLHRSRYVRREDGVQLVVSTHGSIRREAETFDEHRLSKELSEDERERYRKQGEYARWQLIGEVPGSYSAFDLATDIERLSLASTVDVAIEPDEAPRIRLAFEKRDYTMPPRLTDAELMSFEYRLRAKAEQVRQMHDERARQEAHRRLEEQRARHKERVAAKRRETADGQDGSGEAAAG